MILIETSILVAVFRDRSGALGQAVVRLAGSREIVISSFSAFELLVGARDESDWQRLHGYITLRRVLYPARDCWQKAARLGFEARRRGITVRSGFDCCIAQIALDHDVALLHDDRDFESIATMRPLKQIRYNLAAMKR